LPLKSGAQPLASAAGSPACTPAAFADRVAAPAATEPTMADTPVFRN
jgi:hypothetical protein